VSGPAQDLPPYVKMASMMAGPSFVDEPAAGRSGAYRRMLEGGFGGIGGPGFQALMTIPQLLAGGVCERHPGLHFFFVETGARWLAALMDSMDDAWLEPTGAHAREVRRWVITPDGTKIPHRGENEYDLEWTYPLKPSEYVRRQIHVGFMDDWAALRNRGITGIEPLVWGNDYPHYEGTWPNSRSTVDTMVARTGLTDGEAAAIFGGTLASLYRIEQPATV
jgi:hypothetical protein